MMKIMYTELFDFLIKTVNGGDISHGDPKYIGILDIAGFGLYNLICVNFLLKL